MQPTFQAPNRFAGLPTEVIWEILLKANPKDIASYCLTSSEANLICEDESFWREKLWADFGKRKQEEGLKWKEMYQMLSTDSNSPISAGELNYTYYDKEGSLYVADAKSVHNYGQGTFEFPLSHPSHIKISEKMIKIPMPSKVISVSQGKLLMASNGKLFMGAVTEDGMVYIWKNMLLNVRIMSSKVNGITTVTHHAHGPDWGFKFDTEFSLSEGKAIKIVMIGNGRRRINDDGYAIITDNGTIHLNTDNFPDIKIKPDGLYGNFVDIMGSSRVYALTTSGTIVKVKYDWERNQVTYSPIALPEPIKNVSAGNDSYAALSKSGNVYIWGNIADKIDETMTVYEKVTMIDKFPVYKVNLPRPISFIHTANSKLVAVSIDGKLYVLRVDDISKPIEKRVGHRVKYVAVGSFFTISVASDGTVNYWDN